MTDALVGTRFATEWDSVPNPDYDVWTSVNAGEILPGIVPPLVASTLTRSDHACLRKLMATYPGGDLAVLHEPPVANFFAVFGGRMALNNAWSVAAVSVQDAQIAQAILQQFFTGATGGERYLVEVPDDVRVAAAAVAAGQRAAAPLLLEGWRAALYAERSSDRAERDRRLPLAAAWDRWCELWHDNCCDLLATHYVVSVAAGEFQVRLGGVLQAGGLDPNLVVALCSGLGEVESSRPASRLYELSVLVRRHPEVAGAFEAGDLDAVAGRLVDGDGAWAEVGAAFRSLLHDYGYRGQGEIDPTNPDWSDEPAFALSQVRGMLAVPDDESPAANIARAVQRREALEAQLRDALPEELRGPFDATLAEAQRFTRMRELTKSTWVLGGRRARAPYLALATALAEAGVVDDADDARFLLFDEVAAVAAGDALPDARERVARRRAQAAEAERHRLADNWTGAPEVVPVGDADLSVDVLTGLGVSIGDGVVRGPARIVPSAEAGLGRDLQPGDVLVAPFTDAPWTPLFVVAGAVVVETGGVLSHAATVAREFGIPAVVMVKDATRVIGDGDLVEVDGATGTVHILARVEGSP